MGALHVGKQRDWFVRGQWQRRAVRYAHIGTSVRNISVPAPSLRLKLAPTHPPMLNLSYNNNSSLSTPAFQLTLYQPQPPPS